MKVFLPIATQQTLTVIPRFNESDVSLSIFDEYKRVNTVNDYTTSYLNGYMRIDFSYPFVEGRSYSIEITTLLGELIYRGKAFCTAQTDLENYVI